MAQRSRAYLYALWITGYVPTQSDYVDFFDSKWNILDDSVPGWSKVNVLYSSFPTTPNAIRNLNIVLLPLKSIVDVYYIKPNALMTMAGLTSASIAFSMNTTPNQLFFSIDPLLPIADGTNHLLPVGLSGAGNALRLGANSIQLRAATSTIAGVNNNLPITGGSMDVWFRNTILL